MATAERGGAAGAARSVAFEVADGVTLRGDAFGDPRDPVVLFLHGGGQTRHSWTGTAGRLRGEGWNAITLDLRGHGDSDWAPDGDYAWLSFVSDLHAVLARFDHRPVVVGASLGGLTALLAEGESDESVMSAVVLVDVTPRMERKGVDRIIRFMTDRPEGYANLDEVAEAVAAYNPHRRRKPDPSGLLKNLRQGPDGRYRWHWDPAFLTRSGVHPDASPPDTERLLRAASSLSIPTLLVRGQVSDVVSGEGAREFLAAAPHARYVDVSGAGHMVAGDRNDAFSDGVIGFLRDLPRSAPSDRSA